MKGTIVLPKGFAPALIKSQEDEAMQGTIGLFVKTSVPPNHRLGGN